MTGVDGNSASSAFVAAQYGLQSASEGISQASSSIAQRQLKMLWPQRSQSSPIRLLTAPTTPHLAQHD